MRTRIVGGLAVLTGFAIIFVDRTTFVDPPPGVTYGGLRMYTLSIIGAVIILFGLYLVFKAVSGERTEPRRKPAA